MSAYYSSSNRCSIKQSLPQVLTRHIVAMDGFWTRLVSFSCAALFFSSAASAPIDLKTILAQLKQDGACVSKILHETTETFGWLTLSILVYGIKLLLTRQSCGRGRSEIRGIIVVILFRPGTSRSPNMHRYSTEYSRCIDRGLHTQCWFSSQYPWLQFCS